MARFVSVSAIAKCIGPLTDDDLLARRGGKADIDAKMAADAEEWLMAEADTGEDIRAEG